MDERTIKVLESLIQDYQRDYEAALQRSEALEFERQKLKIESEFYIKSLGTLEQIPKANSKRMQMIDYELQEVAEEIIETKFKLQELIEYIRLEYRDFKLEPFE